MEGGRGRASLPDADAAFVEPAKLTEYLLNPDHPVGGDKAAFLARFGFRPEHWPILEAALLAHARSGCHGYLAHPSTASGCARGS